MQRPIFSGEENNPDQRRCNFWKLFSLLIFGYFLMKIIYIKISWWYARILFQQIVSFIAQLSLNEHDFKSIGPQMFCKIIVKNFTKFLWKHLRPVNLSKRDSSTGVSHWFLWNFWNENSFFRDQHWTTASRFFH